MLQNILSVLSNFTGMVTNENATMGVEDLEACGAPRTMGQGEEEGGEERTEEQNSRRSESRSSTDSYTGEESGTRTVYEETGHHQSQPVKMRCSKFLVIQFWSI